MKLKNFRAQLRYRFDCLMSRGMIAMIALLGCVTAAVVCVIGLFAHLVADEGSFVYQAWMGLMHTLDAGNLAGNATDNVPYLIMMSVATLCGLFITSILIGVIASGVEARLNDLRKGISSVQEQGHTVIIGFNENIFSMLSELIEANSNHKKSRIVVLGQQSKEEMEEAIASRIPDTRTTRIICRSGALYEEYSFERCAVEKARSVIVNVYDDAETIKSILALTAYLKRREPLYPGIRFVAALQDKQNIEAARIAGEGQADIIYATDTISRIIAHTCRQHGLSQVMVELFNFSGNELYIESVPELEGGTFRDALNKFSNATVIGLCKGDDVRLNPPMDTIIRKGDSVVLLEIDDGAYSIAENPVIENAAINEVSSAGLANDDMIILGSNDKLPLILQEYDRYVAPGTEVVIVDDDFNEERLCEYANLTVSSRKCAVDRALLEELLTDEIDNVLILNDDSEAPERSDARTLLQLLLLRDIADRTGKRFAITTEMQCVDNQRLASRAKVDDFVISFNITCLLMAQISENHKLLPLINDLLDEDGSEFYMKPAGNYVRIGEKVNAYTLTESAARRGEIFVGYRHTDKDGMSVVVNPKKDEFITLEEKDMVIVIAEE